MMEAPTLYLETGSTDPAYNLAFEETVLNCRWTGEILILWQNENTVVIGQNQNAEAEIDRAFVEAHNIRVIRRMTGGGAVYHDLGNLNYSFITDAGDAEHLTLERFTRPIVEALRGLGLSAEASGRNDILVEGRKVSGTAQRIAKGRILYHGTLLFDANPDMIAGALQADPAKFQSKSTRSVRSRVVNIRPLLRVDMELPAFWAYLKEFLGKGALRQDALTEAELEQVRRLKVEKYDTWEWNFGKSPLFSVRRKQKWDGGILEVGANVEEGRIAQIRFYGDFLSLAPLGPLEQALEGCPFRREDVGAVLDACPLPLYFGSLRKQEILNTLFLG